MLPLFVTGRGAECHYRNDAGRQGRAEMAIRTAHTREAWVDFVELVAKAFFGGLAVAVVMALAILVVSPGAEARSVGVTDAGGSEVTE